MGLRIDVYRHKSEWPSDDISAVVDHLTVVNITGPFTPDEKAPAYLLQADDYYPNYPMLVPLDVDTGKPRIGMASGNYAGKGGIRWIDAVARITGCRSVDLVSVHDRYEDGGAA